MQNQIQKLTVLLKQIMYDRLLIFVDNNYNSEELKEQQPYNKPKMSFISAASAITDEFFGLFGPKEIDFKKLRSMRTPTFSETLFKMIDERGIKKDSEVYGKVGIDRRLFSKIRIHPDYRPAKSTVLMLAIALELDVDETNILLETAGYTLSHSIMQDLIVEFFISNKVYDIMTINEALYDCGEKTLGV